MHQATYAALVSIDIKTSAPTTAMLNQWLGDMDKAFKQVEADHSSFKTGVCNDIKKLVG